MILKKDGKVGWAMYVDGERLNGPDAMAPEFMDALRKLTTRPTPEARDAARYRWLRGEGFDRPASMWVINFATKIPVVHTDLDAAIDAALALPAQGEGKA